MIRKIDFDNIKSFNFNSLYPRILLMDKVCYRLQSWNHFMQIFLYYGYKTEYGKLYIDLRNDSEMFTQDEMKFPNRVKFASNLYFNVNVEKEETMKLVNSIVQSGEMPSDFVLYCDTIEDNKSVVEGKIKQIKSKYKRNYSSSTIVKRINSMVMSEQEVWFNSLRKVYNKVNLLGDVFLDTEKKEKYMYPYFEKEIQRLKQSDLFIPIYPKIFALAFVHYEKERYNRDFYGHLSKIYGGNIPQSKKDLLINAFVTILSDDNKTLCDYSDRPYEVVLMHSFVTDNYMKQFAEYMFSVWKGDFKCHFEKNYSTDIMKGLINDLKHPNSADRTSTAFGVRKNTSLAVISNPTGSRNRLVNILKTFDKLYSDEDLPKSNNRFYNYLRKWSKIPGGSFELSKSDREKHSGRSYTINQKPFIYIKNDSFVLALPIQRVHKDNNIAKWECSINGNLLISNSNIEEGTLASYTQYQEIILQKKDVFGEMQISFITNEKRIELYKKTKEDFIFFNLDQQNMIEVKHKIFSGNYRVYSLSSINLRVNEVLYEDKNIEELYFVDFSIVDTDWINFGNDNVLIVGEDYSNNYYASDDLSDSYCIIDGKEYKIRKKISPVKVFCTKEEFNGSQIIITDNSIEHTFYLHKLSFKQYSTANQEKYLYVVDLTNLVKENHTYTIFYNVLPKLNERRTFDFVYLPDFSYEFIGAPYVFADYGTLVVNKKLNFIHEGDGWEVSGNNNKLSFNFDEIDNAYVSDKTLNLKYNLDNKIIRIKILIPAFYWKFEKEEKWHTHKPGLVNETSLKGRMLFSGNVSFRNSMLFPNETGDFEGEFKVKPSLQEDGDWCINLPHLRQWFDSTVEEPIVYFVLDSVPYRFLSIITTTKVVSKPMLCYFQNASLIFGNVNVVGALDYYMNIYSGETLIKENIKISSLTTFAFENPTKDLIFRCEILGEQSGDEVSTPVFASNIQVFEFGRLNTTLKIKSFLLSTGEERKNNSSYNISDVKPTSLEKYEDYEMLDVDYDSIDTAILYECKLSEVGYYSVNALLVLYVGEAGINNVQLLLLNDNEKEIQGFIYDIEKNCFLKPGVEKYYNRIKRYTLLRIFDYEHGTISIEW